MIMCSIMLCSRLQRCLATPQTCVASAGKGKNTSQVAMVATSRALAACRNNSSTSMCASTRSSTGWPTVAPPFSDHAITLGVPGHLVGTENRCPSPPTASHADQQQLSYYLHEWLEAALLQHANLSTTGCVHSDAEGRIAGQQPTACNLSEPCASSSSSAGTLQGNDWQHIEDMSVSERPEGLVSSSGSPAASVDGGLTSSLDDLEVPMAGLSDAAVLHDHSDSGSGPSSSNNSSKHTTFAVDSIEQAGLVVLGHDAVLAMDTCSEDSDGVVRHSSSQSDKSDDGWSVVSAHTS